MMGRPSRLTDDIQVRITQLVTVGVPPETAAMRCGIGTRLFYEWMARGRGVHRSRAPMRVYSDFAAVVLEAAARCEVALVLQIHEFIEGHRRGARGERAKSRLTLNQIRAIEWFLMKRAPQRWAERRSAPRSTPAKDADDKRARIVVTHAAKGAPEMPGPQSPEELASDVARSPRRRGAR